MVKKATSFLKMLQKNKEFILLSVGIALLLFIIVKCMSKQTFNIMEVADEELGEELDEEVQNELSKLGTMDPSGPTDLPAEKIALVGAPEKENVEMASNGASSTGETVIEGYYS